MEWKASLINSFNFLFNFESQLITFFFVSAFSIFAKIGKIKAQEWPPENLSEFFSLIQKA